MLPALVALAFFFSMFANLHRLPFKNEESLRLTVAYEMYHTGNYLQPTFLGELYFNKPPLFNWLIVAYSYLFPWSELTLRALSLSATAITCLLVFLFALYLLKDKRTALIASLLYLSFGNVLFFYGFLGEIDAVFTLFVFAGMISLYLWWEKSSWLFASLSGFLFGLSFLLKGFPAFAFFGISLLTLSLYHRKPFELLKPKALLSYALCIAPPTLWLLTTQEPFVYLKTLWMESFSRVSDKDFSRLWHVLSFPLINFKDLLPASALFVFALWVIRKELFFPKVLLPVLLLFLFNYLPYLFSNSAGRYIMPLYPLLALLFSPYVSKALEKEGFKRAFYGVLLFVLLLRIAYGLVYFPYVENKDTSRKRIAKEIFKLTESHSVACECPEEKSICLYLSLWRGEPIKRLHLTEPRAGFAVVCENRLVGNVVKEFSVGGRKVYLTSLPSLAPH